MLVIMVVRGKPNIFWGGTWCKKFENHCSKVRDESNQFWFLDTHINSIVKKAQQRLYFLHQLRKFNLPQELLKQFYSAVIESVLCTSITVWFGSATKSGIRRLQRTVRTAKRIIGAPLPTLQELYLSRVRKRAQKITLDPSHPSHPLFELLPSGRRYRAPITRTARHKNSFFHQAIHLMNSTLGSGQSSEPGALPSDNTPHKHNPLLCLLYASVNSWSRVHHQMIFKWTCTSCLIGHSLWRVSWFWGWSTEGNGLHAGSSHVPTAACSQPDCDLRHTYIHQHTSSGEWEGKWVGFLPSQPCSVRLG